MGTCRRDTSRRFDGALAADRCYQSGMARDHSAPPDSPAGLPSARIHLAILVGVCLAYLLVRAIWQPTHGFARNHLTDLLAGVALPSLFGLMVHHHAPWRAWLAKLRHKLLLIIGATLSWEVLQPLLSDRSTADLIDAACYVAGALGQHGIVRLLHGGAEPKA
jgi:hypothetical protein